MSTIEETVISNYQENMLYFQKNHPALHNKLQALEILLEEGKFPQKYDLEYKDDYFDVLELSSNNYLYGTSSEKYSNELARNVSLKKDTQVIESFYNYNFTQESLDALSTADANVRHSTTAHIINYCNNNTSKQTTFEKIYKYIFIGTGLALHIPMIMKKISPEVVLIIEDNIELFRLSLFTCNYKLALENKMTVFSVAENSDEFSENFKKFYEDAFIRNHYLKFSLFSSSSELKIKQIQTLIVSRAEKCYTQDRLLVKNRKILNILQQKYNFLDLSKKENETFFMDKPILVVGAGPSLLKNIEWLKEHQENFIILALFVTIKILHNHNMTPDIIMHIDENDPPVNAVLKQFDDFEFLNDSIFIFSASVSDILFKTFKKENTYLLEDRSKYKHNNTFLESASVGESAYALSLILNPSEVYLLGIDLALSDDGYTHSKGHASSSTDKQNISKADKLEEIASLRDSVINIKGNFRPSVTTTPLFAMSIPMLNNFTKNLLSPNQVVYNLSDGAYFYNTHPLHIKDIKYSERIPKKEVAITMNQLLTSYSQNTFTTKELNQIQEREQQVEDYYNYLQVFNNKPTANSDLFINAYKKLLTDFLSSQRTELLELISIYFLNTSTYVTDLFNTKELKNSKKHCKNIKKIIVAHIEKILKAYEKSLSQIK